MDLTVLISTWNNSRCLEMTLEAFRECLIPDGLRWELIIVNNNCTDDTDQVIAKYADALPIYYVREPVQGLSRARNTGVAVASGDFIIFTDDDVKPCPEWIKIYWQAFRKGDPAKYFWGGPIESEFESNEPDQDLLAVSPSSVRGLTFGTQKRLLSKNEYFVSINWGTSLDIIRKAGGFDIHKGLGASKALSTGEETGLMDKLRSRGLMGIYLPDAMVKHYVPLEKCTAEHILKRCEAGALDGYDRYYFRLKQWVWFNRPVGLYVHAVVAFGRYLWKKFSFQGGMAEYIRFRIVTAITQGYTNNLRKNQVKLTG